MLNGIEVDVQPAVDVVGYKKLRNDFNHCSALKQDILLFNIKEASFWKYE